MVLRKELEWRCDDVHEMTIMPTVCGRQKQGQAEILTYEKSYEIRNYFCT
jgi:hypothetical protein